MDRNNAVHALQGNRNPFVDQPSWVSAIWGPTAAANDAGELLLFTVRQVDGLLHLERSLIEPWQVAVLDPAGRQLVRRTWSGTDLHLAFPGTGPCLVEVRSARGRSVRRLMP